MKNQELARIFNSIADILELKGENLFRVNAYRKAGRILQDLTRPVETLASERKLGDFDGRKPVVAVLTSLAEPAMI